ncbi:MAG: DUF3616 domain-containing protein [Polyangiales bacterium]
MNARIPLVLSLALASCVARSDAAPALELPVFTGMCDASAAIALGPRTFAVANDEDNVIRAYDAERPGAPIREVDLSDALGLPVRTKKNKKHSERKPAPEIDLEAATRVGDLALWISSHGRSDKGKPKPERLMLFVTTAPADGALEVVGAPYTRLIDDLAGDPRYAGFGLREAAERAPKEAGGLNIEGMAARREGGVYIGFRGPVTRGKALIATLLNPEEVVRGGAARFDAPIALDLGGLGVRELTARRDRYLLIAGDQGSERVGQVYAWDGASGLSKLRADDLAALNPEGVFSHEGRADVLLLSDDGTETVGGVACKKLKDGSQKRFRGMWLTADRL